MSSHLENNALASASLILQPPENSFVVRFCISEENPKPARMTDALAGALSASMLSSFAYTSLSSALSVASGEL